MAPYGRTLFHKGTFSSLVRIYWSTVVDNSWDAPISMDLEKLTNAELIDRLKRLVQLEKLALIETILHLIEFDKRKLYADAGYPSLFAYCTFELGYSEAATHRRIRTARAAQHWPQVLALLENGKIHMETIALLNPYLNEHNHIQLLEQAQGKSRREVEFMVAALSPKQDVADRTQLLPGPSRDPGTSFSVAASPISLVPANLNFQPHTIRLPTARTAKQEIKPLSPQRVHFGFTGSAQLLRNLDRAKELLRPKFPGGRLEDIVMELLEIFLNMKDPERKLRRKTILPWKAPPHKSSRRTRRISQWVKDEVWKRDAGQCTYMASDGLRCPQKVNLEFDHIIPWARGGSSLDVSNIRLLCRAHNQLFARRIFGPATKNPKASGT